MKLADTIINNLEFKTKKNNSLISSIERLKYQDLLGISNIIDNPTFLNEYSSGWNALHYSIMNNNIEVLFFIANLYKKNNCDLTQCIQRAKNATPLNSNALDIAINNQKFDQYIILKNFNINPNNNLSYFLKRQRKQNNEDDNISIHFPYELSLANLFLLSYQSIGLTLFNKEFIYDEKATIEKEFLANHHYICENYIDHEIFQTYHNFFGNMIKLKNNLSLNCFDFFAIPFIESFKNNKEYINYSCLNYFYLLYPENNRNEFFEQLNSSQYKDKMISIFTEMKVLINDETKKTKNIRHFFDIFNIDKLIFSLELFHKLTTKNTIQKINKI